MTEFEAIYKRHSVRNYQNKKIEAEKLAQLKEMIALCNREGNLNLQFIEEAGGSFNRLLTRVMGLGSAPSLIACVGANDGSLDERIGYYGQKIVLFAQTLGLNTCWAGTFNEKNVNAVRTSGDKMPIVIAIGYGVDDGRVRKSKTADDVVEGGIEGKPEWFKHGVEAALLAPTAVNQQKFKIALKADGTAEVSDMGGILSKIDLGIVRYNFEVGSKH